MPDGTDFCTNCGARMGTASPAAAPAEPASMPAAGMPPVQGDVQKKSHKRAVIIGICVAGVLVAGGAALALTGVLGPLGQGNSSQITVLGSDEGSAELKDQGSAKEKPAEEQEEPEEPGQTGSSVKVDLNDQATYTAANLFLSNFTEEHFDLDWYQAGDFDSTDGLTDDEKYKLVKFIWCHFIDNAPYRIEKGDYDNGHFQRIATDVINRELNRLTGLTLSDADMTFDRASGGQVVPIRPKRMTGICISSKNTAREITTRRVPSLRVRLTLATTSTSSPMRSTALAVRCCLLTSPRAPMVCQGTSSSRRFRPMRPSAVPRLARFASSRVTAPRPSHCSKWASTTRLGV